MPLRGTTVNITHVIFLTYLKILRSGIRTLFEYVCSTKSGSGSERNFCHTGTWTMKLTAAELCLL